MDKLPILALPIKPLVKPYPFNKRISILPPPFFGGEGKKLDILPMKRGGIVRRKRKASKK